MTAPADFVEILPLTAAPPAVAGDTRMHLVLLIDQFPQALGGGERVVLRMGRLLQGAGLRVSIVTFQVLCDPALLVSAGCPVYLLPVDSVFSAGALREAWRFGRFLRRTRAAFVMTFFESSNLFGGISARLFSRARVVWNRRDMGILRSGKHTAAYRWLRWLPAHVIAVSGQVQRHAIQVDGIAPERVSVVYNGVAASETAGPRAWPDPPVVVTVGNVRAVKGHDVLVEAAAIVLRSFPQVRFRIAGEPLEAAFVARLRERIDELGIADRVALVGGVADPRPLLREASIFVLPSRSEGFSNAIAEAMMEGLPVVATDVGGNAEAIVDGVAGGSVGGDGGREAETGLLVQPDQPEALAAALLTLLADRDRARKMGDNGRIRANRLFSNQALVDRVAAILQAVSISR